MAQYMIVTEDGANIGRVEIFKENVTDRGWDITSVCDANGRIKGFELHHAPVEVLVEPDEELPKEDRILSIWDKEV